MAYVATTKAQRRKFTLNLDGEKGKEKEEEQQPPAKKSKTGPSLNAITDRINDFDILIQEPKKINDASEIHVEPANYVNSDGKVGAILIHLKKPHKLIWDVKKFQNQNNISYTGALLLDDNIEDDIIICNMEAIEQQIINTVSSHWLKEAGWSPSFIKKVKEKISTPIFSLDIFKAMRFKFANKSSLLDSTNLWLDNGNGTYTDMGDEFLNLKCEEVKLSGYFLIKNYWIKVNPSEDESLTNLIGFTVIAKDLKVTPIKKEEKEKKCPF